MSGLGGVLKTLVSSPRDIRLAAESTAFQRRRGRSFEVVSREYYGKVSLARKELENKPAASSVEEPILSRRTLNHFAFFRFRKAHETAAVADRVEVHRRWLEALRSAAARVEVFQVFPTRADADVLVWSALPYEDDQTPRRFFEAFAKATLPYRRYVKSTEILWGMTRPSPYVSGKKPRGMDPIEGKRQSYLTLYPFVKTAQWYGMGRESRQGMMNEHIRIGRQFPEVDQLLLYSFGLQDQEFVVVYEMEDLPRYSELVSQLRSCDGRPFTERDTPIYTAVHHPAEETLALWE